MNYSDNKMPQQRMAHKSVIWKHFKVSADNKEKAECQLCDPNSPTRFLSRGRTPRTFSTKPLWNHIKSRHPIQLTELNRINYESAEREKKPTESTHATWSLQDSRSQAISRKIGESFIRLTGLYIFFYLVD